MVETRKNNWLRMGVAVIALGIIPALISLIFAGSSLRSFQIDAVSGILYAASIAIPCWVTINRLFCRYDDYQVRSLILIAFGLMCGFAVLGSLFTTAVLHLMGLHGSGSFLHAWYWALRICLAVSLTFGMILLGVEVLRGQLDKTKQELHERQVAEERERKTAAEARFASLESRVHPHFLFNTLNSISALVREDPVRAERLIERLSTLLRFSLDSEVGGLVKLSEELSIVRDYLEIEGTRFGARLRYQVTASSESETRQVPALSVQTLVENSVKYAVGARREGAEITVVANVTDSKLRVVVSDDGPGFDPAAGLRPGHGLDLLKQRLITLFGPGAQLDIESSAGRTRITIECP